MSRLKSLCWILLISPEGFFFHLFHRTFSLNVHVRLQVDAQWFGGVKHELEPTSGNKHQSVVFEKKDKDAHRLLVFFTVAVLILLSMWHMAVIVFALDWFIVLREAPVGFEEVTWLRVHIAMSKEIKKSDCDCNPVWTTPLSTV